MEEFQCLGELGKYSHSESFKTEASEFFWRVISDSDQYKEELVTNCIEKFCEMVKTWPLEKKHHFFILLVKNLQSRKSSIPSLRLFKKLVGDHLDFKKQQDMVRTAYGGDTGSYPPKV